MTDNAQHTPGPREVMFRFGNVSHVSKNPAGTWSINGAVPQSCLKLSDPPTRSQIMGGRVFNSNGHTGRAIGWDFQGYPTANEAAEAVLSAGGTLCTCAGCYRPEKA